MEAELIEGDGGVFDVAMDGHVVFSKQKAQDFTAIPEMVELVRGHLTKA